MGFFLLSVLFASSVCQNLFDFANGEQRNAILRYSNSFGKINSSLFFTDSLHGPKAIVFVFEKEAQPYHRYEHLMRSEITDQAPQILEVPHLQRPQERSTKSIFELPLDIDGKVYTPRELRAAETAKKQERRLIKFFASGFLALPSLVFTGASLALGSAEMQMMLPVAYVTSFVAGKYFYKAIDLYYAGKHFDPKMADQLSQTQDVELVYTFMALRHLQTYLQSSPKEESVVTVVVPQELQTKFLENVKRLEEFVPAAQLGY